SFYPEQPPTGAHPEHLRKHLPKYRPPEAPTQAPPPEVPQIETHTQREEWGNTASSQPPPANTPAGPSRGMTYGRVGTDRGGESHVNKSTVSKLPHCGGHERGRPRGLSRGEAYSGMGA